MYTTVDASGSLGPTVYFLGYIVIVLLMFSNVFIGLVVDRFQVTAVVCLLGGPTTKQATSYGVVQSVFCCRIWSNRRTRTGWTRRSRSGWARCACCRRVLLLGDCAPSFTLWALGGARRRTGSECLASTTVGADHLASYGLGAAEAARGPDLALALALGVAGGLVVALVARTATMGQQRHLPHRRKTPTGSTPHPGHRRRHRPL